VGTRTVDNVPSGPGDRLAQLTLAGDHLNWTRDATAEQTTLRQRTAADAQRDGYAGPC
jgi:hypothetical protein